jgi:hypothetical protein
MYADKIYTNYRLTNTVILVLDIVDARKQLALRGAKPEDTTALLDKGVGNSQYMPVWAEDARLTAQPTGYSNGD